MLKDEKPLIGKIGLNFQVDQLTRVAIAMRSGDVSECKNNELMHAVDVLALLIGIDEIAPGVINEVLNTLAGHYVKQLSRNTVASAAAKQAAAAGCSAEWLAALDAARHPKQKDMLLRMVELEMKASQVDQNQAITAVAQQTGKDEDSVRRIVNRSKARSKRG